MNDITCETRKLQFTASLSSGRVSAILTIPDEAFAILALAHGAGAGMQHPFMQGLARELARCGIASLRYQFPYMEAGKKPPNPPAILVKTVESAVLQAAELMPDLPLFAGGKSLGGRMSSTAASQDKLQQVTGIVFFGFPLHAPGKPSSERAAHLYEVKQDMLFLQGTRDKLADLELLNPVINKLAKCAKLHTIDDADHSFHVPKRSGRSDDEVIRELTVTTRDWMLEILA